MRYTFAPIGASMANTIAQIIEVPVGRPISTPTSAATLAAEATRITNPEGSVFTPASSSSRGPKNRRDRFDTVESMASVARRVRRVSAETYSTPGANLRSRAILGAGGATTKKTSTRSARSPTVIPATRTHGLIGSHRSSRASAAGTRTLGAKRRRQQCARRNAVELPLESAGRGDGHLRHSPPRGRT